MTLVETAAGEIVAGGTITSDTNTQEANAEKAYAVEYQPGKPKNIGNFNDPRRIAAPLLKGRNSTVPLIRSQVALAPRSATPRRQTEPLELLD